MSTAWHVDQESLNINLAMLDKVGRSISPLAVQSMDNALEIVYQDAQARVPIGVGANAGALARSMDHYIFDMRPDRGFIAGKVTMKNREEGQKVYANMREFGGTIRPKPTNPIGRLVWTDEFGRLIFAKEVTQVGSLYMSGAAENSKQNVVDEFNLMMSKVVKFREAV